MVTAAVIRVRIVVLGVALALLVLVQGETRWDAASRRDQLLSGWLPVAVIVALVGMALYRQRWVLAAAVVVAVSPAIVAQFGTGRRSGAVAVAAIVVGVAAGPVARRRAALAVGGVVVFGLVASVWWWSTTPARTDGGVPSWATLVTSTGSYVERMVGGLGGGALAPTTAALAWWLAVGVIVAAVVASGVPRAVLVPAVGVLVFVGSCIVLERWRGPVDPVAGAWLLSGPLVYAAFHVALPRLPTRRLAGAMFVLVGWCWGWSVAAQVRFVAVDVELPPPWWRWREWDSATGGATASTMLPVVALATLGVAATGWRLPPRSRDRRGVNVVGYHTITAGLGERARELSAALRAVGVPVADHDLDVDSVRESEQLPPSDVRYDTTVVVAPAFEIERIAQAHPELFRDRRLVAGYLFWELDGAPATHVGGLAIVDEVWAPTRFVGDAYSPVAPVPVRHAPLPIPEPVAAPLGRAELGLDPDAFVLLMSFSHLSVMERKNPLGAIEAFRRAFPVDAEGADAHRLVIKTLNGDRKPEDARRLARAAAADRRVSIRDERVEHADLMALVQASDVFVSLHRSEGLGLQIADAMWLGTPVIATDYSGSRDLLDVGLAELVPWRPTPVTDGDGAYPESMTWADPDLDAAAAAMRRLASDPARRARLAQAARRRMEAQPDRAAAGRLIAKLAGCAVRR